MNMKITRRNALGILATSVSTAALEQDAAAQTAPNEAVTAGWLGGSPPAMESGVSWGVPWPRGAVRKGQSFSLTTADGKALPLQNWPLAYWPDGSMKWIGFCHRGRPGNSGAFKLARGTAAAPATAVKVAESGEAIDIDTGKLQCRIPRGRAAFLIDSMTMDGRVVARQGTPGVHAERPLGVCTSSGPQGHRGTDRAGARGGQNRRRSQG
jgi:hypothetical protein